MSTPGIGERAIPWPSFGGQPFGGANPTCATCGGRARGAKKCECPEPDWRVSGEPLEDDTNKGVEPLGQKQQFQAWSVSWLRECYRVIAPGGVIKVFGATRMYHRMAAAMEEAGFMLDPEYSLEAWGYGSGFPKSLNVSKAIDKAAGADPAVEGAIQVHLREQREALGLTKGDVDRQVFGGTTRYSWVEGRGGQRADESYLPTPEEWTRLKAVLHLDDRYDAYIQKAIPSRADRFKADGGKGVTVGEEPGDWGYQQDGGRWDGIRRLTAPATEEAQRFDGYGTALKPAWEPFLVGRKPQLSPDPV